MSNLLVNAVQHGGGDVILSVSGYERDHVVVTVRNAGRPIPADQLPGLFEAFRKGDGNPDGLGLGLFIVREIVRAHAGTIVVASSPEWTTFTISLPRRQTPDRLAERSTSSASPSCDLESEVAHKHGPG